MSFASSAGIVDVCSAGRALDFSEELAKKVLLEKEVSIIVTLHDAMPMQLPGGATSPMNTCASTATTAAEVKTMNELTDFDIARLLSDSLKYVRLYRNHTVVVKYGGNA